MVGRAETILLNAADERVNSQTVKEALGVGVITPGHLLERAAGEVQVHGTAQGAQSGLFALENIPVSGDIDTDYADGDTVRFEAMRAGDIVNALVIDGTAAILVDDELASDGAGGVVTASTAADVDSAVIGRALEAVDNSGGSVPVRIKMEMV